MVKRKHLLVVIGALLTFLQSISAQINHNEQFLQSVGTIDSLYSEGLQEYREIYVQLPAYYNPNSPEKYPVVYILDGEVLLPTVNNVHSFYSGGFIPEMILIGISNSSNRTRDLTTSKIKERYGRTFQEEHGEAEKFVKFLESELIPFIENKYPVTEFRTLIGHSFGGLFALYTLINHPQIFSNYVAIDPSVEWDNQKLLRDARSRLSSQNYDGQSLFMSLSSQLHKSNPHITIENVEKDTSESTLFSRSIIDLAKLIEQNSHNGLSFDWKFYNRDLHGTIPYPSIMDGLIFDFEWFQMEHTDKFNSFETSKEELEEIINYRAQKLESHFHYPAPPYPEDLLNVLGLMSMDMDQAPKSKMFFEMAIRFYPSSANAFNAMADYYEINNDYKNALKFLIKAYSINGDKELKEKIELLKVK